MKHLVFRTEEHSFKKKEETESDEFLTVKKLKEERKK
jgi:hypothetical protein